MQKLKFDETDRRQVITAIEEHYKIRLTPVGNRRKHLHDEQGRTYWVLGGYENWHGISAEMMEADEKLYADGTLVIAVKKLGKIDLYIGPLLPLIKSKRTLSHTENGAYQFNIQIQGDKLTIKEVQKYNLVRFGTTRY
jgi:hypothetical protein